MTIRVSVKRTTLAVLALALLLIILGFVLILHNVTSRKSSQTERHRQYVTHLKNDVGAIKSLNSAHELTSSSSDQIVKYSTAVSNMIETCQNVRQYFDTIKNLPSAQPIKSSAIQVNNLCTDLHKVAQYALSQSEATKEFMLFRADSLNDPINYQQKQAELQKILEMSRLALEKLASDSINDPAVQEQLALLQRLQQIIPINGSDNSKITELITKTQTTQQDFLSTRTYFWNNTIQIDNLESAIDSLARDFNK